MPVVTPLRDFPVARRDGSVSHPLAGYELVRPKAGAAWVADVPAADDSFLTRVRPVGGGPFLAATPALTCACARSAKRKRKAVDEDACRAGCKRQLKLTGPGHGNHIPYARILVWANVREARAAAAEGADWVAHHTSPPICVTLQEGAIQLKDDRDLFGLEFVLRGPHTGEHNTVR